jgi:hypothetical protein
MSIGANFLAQAGNSRSSTFTFESIPAFAVATAVLSFAILIPVYVLTTYPLSAPTHLSLS